MKKASHVAVQIKQVIHFSEPNTYNAFRKKHYINNDNFKKRIYEINLYP